MTVLVVGVVRCRARIGPRLYVTFVDGWVVMALLRLLRLQIEGHRPVLAEPQGGLTRFRDGV